MTRATKSVALATTLLLLSIAPAAGGPRQRTENVPYDTPAGNVMDTLWVEVSGAPEASPLAREKFVSVTLQDDSGRPVAAMLHQGDEELGAFCGSTEEPVRLANREPVHVHIFTGPGCSDVSTATKGTATFTFTR